MRKISFDLSTEASSQTTPSQHTEVQILLLQVAGHQVAVAIGGHHVLGVV
jgi:hypothetical protein